MARLLFVALVTTATGCAIVQPCGSGECPEPQAMRGGSFTATLEDGTPVDVVVDDQLIRLTFTDSDGVTWDVVYEPSLP